MLRISIVFVVVGFANVGTGYASERPLTVAEKKIIADAYGKRLKDPASAQYRWHSLIESTSSKPDQMVYCFQINAKNSYGAFVGFQTVLGKVAHRNGAVVGYSYEMGAESNPIMNDSASEFCEISRYRFQ
jgi:hypothetical protein